MNGARSYKAVSENEGPPALRVGSFLIEMPFFQKALTKNPIRYIIAIGCGRGDKPRAERNKKFSARKSKIREVAKMGAWNYGVFDDDAALDALCDLKESRSVAADAERYFNEAIGAEYIEYEAGTNALVAAAVADAVLNGTQYGDAEDGDDDWDDKWIRSLPVEKFFSLREKAAMAVECVLSDSSELKELWEENEELYALWREDKRKIAERLRNAAQPPQRRAGLFARLFGRKPKN